MSEDSVLGREVLDIARQSIASYFDQHVAQTAYSHPRLKAIGACFVTLTIHEELRGCMGNLEACQPLLDEIRANARLAAFHDPRFPPLTLKEWRNVLVEVSLIGEIEAIHFSSEDEALAQLRPGVDGLILTCGTRRATFLPQVWEMLPDRKMFLNQLKMKAHLSAEFWDAAIRLERYQVEKWKER